MNIDTVALISIAFCLILAGYDRRRNINEAIYWTLAAILIILMWKLRMRLDMALYVV